MTTDPLVLIVEDNDYTRRVLGITIYDLKHISVANAAQAIAECKKQAPDITFVDLGLPDLDGFSLIKAILSLHPSTYIVVITADNEDLSKQKAAEYGAKGYIVKPFTREKIEHYLEQFKQGL